MNDTELKLSPRDRRLMNGVFAVRMLIVAGWLVALVVWLVR